jgi:hypothetical protein
LSSRQGEKEILLKILVFINSAKRGQKIAKELGLCLIEKKTNKFMDVPKISFPKSPLKTFSINFNGYFFAHLKK